MNLSKRLTAVAGLITPGNSIADIGTDHGYIPIYMAQKGLTRKALAMDVNPGPLKRAVENINKYHVEDVVSARLSDGLSMLNEGETDTIVIAGMGGLLMVNILEKYPAKAHAARELILSPHSDVDKVRRFLADNGFCITHEKMVCEDGKYYFIMRVCTGDMRICEETEACFGRILLREKDRVL
ncbi:MAG: tRNA (adenine(22)-N(1))-methyltransferase, partial [Butyrivibrio sp.]